MATRIADVIVATLTNASDGTVTFLSNNVITAIIVTNPSSASIVSFILFLLYPFDGFSITNQPYTTKLFALMFVKIREFL